MAKKREENLLGKIAALLNKPVEEIKEAKAVYTEEEQMYEAQSVLNYFAWRRSLVRGPKETDAQWDARNRVWQYKECEECNGTFAYSLSYDGVKFCSLDCLKAALKKQGVEFHPYRPLHLRYGYSQRPGTVPAPVVEFADSLLAASSSENDESVDSDLPKSLGNGLSLPDQETSLPLQDTQVLQDNLSNTA